MENFLRSGSLMMMMMMMMLMKIIPTGENGSFIDGWRASIGVDQRVL